jgi:hypothetical protein
VSVAGFRPRSSRSTTQPTRDCVKGPAGAPWRTSFRRTLEHAAGPVRALRFAGRSLGPGLRGPRRLGPRSLGVPVFGARRLAGLAFCLRLPAPCYLHRAIRRSASSRTPLPGTVPCSTATSRTAPFGAAPSGTVPSGLRHSGLHQSGMRHPVPAVRPSAIRPVGRASS